MGYLLGSGGYQAGTRVSRRGGEGSRPAGSAAVTYDRRLVRPDREKPEAKV